MPEEELKKLVGKSLKEIAEFFGVPEEMVAFGLKLSKTDE
jgi:Zn-dependent peptidase ImmA (M78 family)